MYHISKHMNARGISPRIQVDSNNSENYIKQSLKLFLTRNTRTIWKQATHRRKDSSSPKLSSPMHLKLTPTKACEVNPEPKFTSTIVATLSNKSIAQILHNVHSHL